MNQIPAGLKYLANKHGNTSNHTNTDFGGGKYDKGSDFLKEHGVSNFVYDPYNRSKEHNDAVMKQYAANGADSVTLLNVLNVIPTRAERLEVLDLIITNMGIETELIIGVYSGNRSGVVKRTSKGWQNNTTKAFYINELENCYTHKFLSIKSDGQFIIVKRLK